MIDYRKLTYQEMAEVVKDMAAEVKNRNPLFANAYVAEILNAAVHLEDLQQGKLENPNFDEADTYVELEAKA